MGTGFREFPPRGRGFSLLGFYSSFKYYVNVRWVEALNGRLIGPKPWDRIDIIFGTPNGATVTATIDLDC